MFKSQQCFFSGPLLDGCDTYQLKRETAKLNLLFCVGIPTCKISGIHLRPLAKEDFNVNFELQSYW